MQRLLYLTYERFMNIQHVKAYCGYYGYGFLGIAAFAAPMLVVTKTVDLFIKGVFSQMNRIHFACLAFTCTIGTLACIPISYRISGFFLDKARQVYYRHRPEEWHRPPYRGFLHKIGVKWLRWESEMKMRWRHGNNWRSR